jgi:predicted ATPase
MAITRLMVSNFRSFGDIDVRLDKFNVLIGPNASGKSNFVQVLKFLRDIADLGLAKALSIQGGFRFIRNATSNKNEPIRITIEGEINTTFMLKDLPSYRIKKVRYELALIEDVGSAGYDIVTDKIVYDGEFIKDFGNIKGPHAKGTFEISKAGEVISYTYSGPEKYNSIISAFNLYPFREPQKNQTLFEFGMFSTIALKELMGDIGIFAFNKRGLQVLSKPGTEIILANDGSNLPQILSNLLLDKNELARFRNFVNYMLPYLTDLTVANISNDVPSLTFKETYAKDIELPFELLSDGTIGIIQLILALNFDKRSIVIIEEPDVGIHPKLISRVVSMMKQASKHKQIIITTHNPEVVRYADLKSLLFIKRDDKLGFSIVIRPNRLKTVRDFLKHDVGAHELFVDGLLGG